MSSSNALSGLSTDRAATLAVRRGLLLLKKHYVFTSLYIGGLILALFGTGTAVAPADESLFIGGMSELSTQTSNDLIPAKERLHQLENMYYQSKGWFSCDENCQQKYNSMIVQRDKYDLLVARRKALISDAKRRVGAWSTFAIRELRDAFWNAWEEGKESARRLTMFDALFIGLSTLGSPAYEDRDNSFILTLLQIAAQFVLNLTVGLGAALIAFVLEAWFIISTYGPSVLSGIGLFLLVLLSAASVVGTAVGGAVGALVGSVFFIVRTAEKRARVEGRATFGHAHLE